MKTCWWGSSHVNDGTMHTASILGFQILRFKRSQYIISLMSSQPLPAELQFRTGLSKVIQCLCLSPSPCLSLLLSAHPLTHILVITSGVPRRNSIGPLPAPSSPDIKLSPCPWTQDQAFIFSHSPALTEGDRMASFPLFLLLVGMVTITAYHLIPVASSLDPLQPPRSHPHPAALPDASQRC